MRQVNQQTQALRLEARIVTLGQTADQSFEVLSCTQDFVTTLYYHGTSVAVSMIRPCGATMLLIDSALPPGFSPVSSRLLAQADDALNALAREHPWTSHAAGTQMSAAGLLSLMGTYSLSCCSQLPSPLLSLCSVLSP